MNVRRISAMAANQKQQTFSRNRQHLHTAELRGSPRDRLWFCHEAKDKNQKVNRCLHLGKTNFCSCARSHRDGEKWGARFARVGWAGRGSRVFYFRKWKMSSGEEARAGKAGRPVESGGWTCWSSPLPDPCACSGPRVRALPGEVCALSVGVQRDGALRNLGPGARQLRGQRPGEGAVVGGRGSGRERGWGGARPD